MTTFARHLIASLRALVVLTVLLGVVYPLAVLVVGQVAFESKADGSMVVVDGSPIGSSLIGQQFDGPSWFHSRPSAAGDGYDAMASSASNLAPSSPDLLALVEQRKADASADDGVAADSVPADAITASGSGLDPHISPEYAAQQVARVAAARGLSVAEVQLLVDQHTQRRLVGFLGEPVVNVLALNLALQRAG